MTDPAVTDDVIFAAPAEALAARVAEALQADTLGQFRVLIEAMKPVLGLDELKSVRRVPGRQW